MLKPFVLYSIHVHILYGFDLQYVTTTESVGSYTRSLVDETEGSSLLTTNESYYTNNRSFWDESERNDSSITNEEFKRNSNLTTSRLFCTWSRDADILRKRYGTSCRYIVFGCDICHLLFLWGIHLVEVDQERSIFFNKICSKSSAAELSYEGKG